VTTARTETHIPSPTSPAAPGAPPPPARSRSQSQSRSRVGRIVGNTLLICAALVFVAPIGYLFLGSFKPSGHAMDGLSAFVPNHLTLHNYSGMLGRFNSPSTGYFTQFYLTSLIVSLAVVCGGLVVNSMAGYALARLRWRGRQAVLLTVIVLIILPFQAIAVPLFYMLNGLRNTDLVQFLPFVANAMSIYLFYTFFTGLPKEMEEAASIDGAGPWRTFVTIIVPMAKPAYATVTILTFLTSWSSFLWPVMMVDQPNVRPLPLEISVFQGQPPYDWGQIFAFGVLMVAPVLLVFLIFQRWFVSGVAASAVKG
jgi:multiple sugar transport system permease protein